LIQVGDDGLVPETERQVWERQWKARVMRAKGLAKEDKTLRLDLEAVRTLSLGHEELEQYLVEKVEEKHGKA
jgi:hypothetical protein